MIDPANPKEKGEGAFYIWSAEEIGNWWAAPRDWFCIAMAWSRDGNVHDDPHGEFTGRNILYQAHALEDDCADSSAQMEEPRSTETALLPSSRVREARPRPHLDDKILTAWNGLMISAFAEGAQVLDEPRYADAARARGEFHAAAHVR